MDLQNRQDGQERSGSVSSPEVPEKAIRRRFDAAYKLRILAEAERCQTPGQLGELLRREGLYSSHLTKWRMQREAGGLDALRPRSGVASPCLTPRSVKNWSVCGARTRG